mmetsp:Transcript_8819/g.28146  ORF Transcript_8819/g.28146 Transcript_8819/m.28146 type:complete len:281 (-) Transcript_8819:782-1624(-)
MSVSGSDGNFGPHVTLGGVTPMRQVYCVRLTLDRQHHGSTSRWHSDATRPCLCLALPPHNSSFPVLRFVPSFSCLVCILSLAHHHPTVLSLHGRTCAFSLLLFAGTRSRTTFLFDGSTVSARWSAHVVHRFVVSPHSANSLHRCHDCAVIAFVCSLTLLSFLDRLQALKSVRRRCAGRLMLLRSLVLSPPFLLCVGARCAQSSRALYRTAVAGQAAAASLYFCRHTSTRISFVCGRFVQPCSAISMLVRCPAHLHPLLSLLSIRRGIHSAACVDETPFDL